MSTQAKYRLWAGCTREDLVDAPEAADEFISSVVSCTDPCGIERGEQRFVPIDLHEETIGIGVVVCELNWTIGIGVENEYDLGLTERANSILTRVRNTFRVLGINVEPKLYHHVELVL